MLVVTPYYNRPPQAGIEAHFRAVAAATDLPVLLYDIPIRSSRKIGHDMLVRLAHEVPNIVGLKDAAGNPAETARTVADTPEDFFVYAGDDADDAAHDGGGGRRHHQRGRPLGRARR